MFYVCFLGYKGLHRSSCSASVLVVIAYKYLILLEGPVCVRRFIRTYDDERSFRFVPIGKDDTCTAAVSPLILIAD